MYRQWYARACASRAAVTVCRLPRLLATLLLPAPYGISLPSDLYQFLLFVPSVVLALGVTAAFTMLMHVSMFYTTSYGGIRVLVIAMTAFLNVAVVPYPFFPAPVRTVLVVLPFAALQNMPLRIYSGSIAGMGALKGIAFQATCWLPPDAVRCARNKIPIHSSVSALRIASKLFRCLSSLAIR